MAGRRWPKSHAMDRSVVWPVVRPDGVALGCRRGPRRAMVMTSGTKPGWRTASREQATERSVVVSRSVDEEKGEGSVVGLRIARPVRRRRVIRISTVRRLALVPWATAAAQRLWWVRHTDGTAAGERAGFPAR